MSGYLTELAQSRGGLHRRGIYSVCSAHPWVLEAAMHAHVSAPGPLLIEATCNQVNQFGGYTGMKPADFRDLVDRLAARAGFPQDRILLGGDHLGPFPWQHLAAEAAMDNACDLVRLFAHEGYTKIHLDASMPCSDDPRPLPDAAIAERAARLCAAAESASGNGRVVYIIGTEVPTPGGAVDALEMQVTNVEAAEAALRLHREAFAAAGVAPAWDRVVGLVVQPGVEFGHDIVEDYQPERARKLTAMLDCHTGLMFEAHSTDYQMPESLAALVRDGFAILKVGPALTYAMRQALFALEAIEEECFPPGQRSLVQERVESAMLAHPEQWQKHYVGTPQLQRRLRMYSYSDRIRYFWTEPAVQQAVNQLMENLRGIEIPETLLSDFLPRQYSRVRSGEIPKLPLPLIFDAIGDALAPYIDACQLASATQAK